jgi:hypothetical protein
MGLPGEIRFNAATSQFEGYNGSEWVIFAPIRINICSTDTCYAASSSSASSAISYRADDDIIVTPLEQQDSNDNSVAEAQKKIYEIPIVERRMRYKGKLCVGQAVVLCANSIVTAWHQVTMQPPSSLLANNLNVFGIVSRVEEDTCLIITEGYALARLVAAAEATPYQKSLKLGEGCLAILNNRGCVYQPLIKPHNDFQQIGYIADTLVYDNNSNIEYVRIYVKPVLHLL